MGKNLIVTTINRISDPARAKSLKCGIRFIPCFVIAAIDKQTTDIQRFTILGLIYDYQSPQKSSLQVEKCS